MFINEKRSLLERLLNCCSSCIAGLRLWDERISLHLGLLLSCLYSRESKRLCIKMHILRLSLIAIITRLERTVCKWWREKFMAWLTPTTILDDLIVLKHLMMLRRYKVGRIMLWTCAALSTDWIMFVVYII